MSAYVNSDEFIRNTSTSVVDLSGFDNYLYIVEQNANALSVDTTDLSLIETHDSSYSGTGFVGSQEQSAYFYRTTGVSPSDVRKVTIGADGSITSDRDSPYHGDYPIASVLYLNNTENKLYDNAGIVYFSSDLTYAGSLAGPIDALAFQGDNPIAARGETLHLFNTAQIEQGSVLLDHTPAYIATLNDTVFSFTIDNSNVTTHLTDISAFSLPDPGQGIDPRSTVYVPEIIQSDEIDVVYLYDRESLSIFRYSTQNEDYINTLPLVNPADWMVYADASSRVYLGYPSGKITYFDITSDTPTEIHFTSLPQSVAGLLDVGDYVFAVDASGAWNTHYTFDINGTLIDSEDWRHRSVQYIWNSHVQRVYHRRDGISPNDIEWTEVDATTGEIGANGGSPYHGDTLSVRLPLISSPDGQLLVNGGGQLVDATSLEVLNALSTDIDDATWINDALVTVEAGTSTLQFWNNDYELDFTYRVPGSFSSRLFNVNGQLLVIAQQAAGPVFSLYEMNPISDTDADGEHDLRDNCRYIENTDQSDFDVDGYGDACDNDDDNDTLNDSVEIALGLNPLDATDALTDLDGDSFTNLVENLLGSGIDDALSTPEPISTYQEDFESDGSTGFYHSGNSLPWSRQFSGRENSYGLQSTYVPTTNQDSSVLFTALFTQGVFGFSYVVQGDSYYRYKLQVLVDGVVERTLNGSSDRWQEVGVALTPGMHTIELRVFADYLYGFEEPTVYVIDDVYFSTDSDGDTVGDLNDNCPSTSNPWQNDSDDDGLGDECDNDPYGQDRDGDGYGDGRDNCPDIANPNQEDVDGDRQGDVCDDVDDRPVDTDGDGIPDQWDNCALVANANQENLDFDQAGDACDSDIDGDGIANVVEEQYSVLDAYNPNDAMIDSDGDGAVNLYEVTHDQSPETIDANTSINLLEYFPLSEHTKLYTSATEQVRATMSRIDGVNTFLLEQTDGNTFTFQLREEGIFLINYTEDDNVVFEFDNYLFMPTTMVPGELHEFEFEFTMLVDGERLYRETDRATIYFMGVGQTVWNEETLPSISLTLDGEETVEFLQGIGEIALEGKTLQTYETSGDGQFVITVDPTDSDTSSNGSSGGSTEGTLFAWLSVLMMVKLWRRRDPY